MSILSKRRLILLLAPQTNVKKNCMIYLCLGSSISPCFERKRCPEIVHNHFKKMMTKGKTKTES